MPHECTSCGRVFADGSKEMLSGCPDCGGNKFQFKPAQAAELESEEGTERSGSPESAADARGSGDRGDRTADSAGGRRDLSEGSSEWPDHGYGSAADADAGSAEDARSRDPPAASDAAADPTDAASDPSPAEPADAGTADSPSDAAAGDESIENPAQANARTDVVSPDEIAAATPEETEGTATPDSPGSPSTDRGSDAPRTDAGGPAPEPRPDDRPDLQDLREELNEQFESIRIVAPGEYELNLMELYDRTEYIISLQEDGRYVIEVPDTWDTTPDPTEE